MQVLEAARNTRRWKEILARLLGIGDAGLAGPGKYVLEQRAVDCAQMPEVEFTRKRSVLQLLAAQSRDRIDYTLQHGRVPDAEVVDRNLGTRISVGFCRIRCREVNSGRLQ